MILSVDCTMICGNLCAPYRVAHVLPPQTVAGTHLSADRREPPHRRSGAPAGDRHARSAGRTGSQRAIGATAALGRALRRQGDRPGCRRRRRGDDDRGATDRAATGVRAAVAGDRLPSVIAALARGRGHRFPAGARGFPHRAAPTVFAAARIAPPIAGGRITGSRASTISICITSIARWPGWARNCRSDQQDGATPFAPRCPKDRDGGAAVRASARSVQPARPGVHGHHQPVFRGRGRPDARTAWLLQGPPAGSAPDDPGRAARWRRPAGVLGDVARQHRRCHQPDAGDRPAAQALRHRPRLRRRRPRHDQRRDHRRAWRRAACSTSSACASAPTSWCARSCSTIPRPSCRW